MSNHISRERQRKHIIELLLPNTKPVVVGTIYCPPNQTNFVEIFNKNLSKVDIITLKNTFLVTST